MIDASARCEAARIKQAIKWRGFVYLSRVSRHQMKRGSHQVDRLRFHQTRPAGRHRDAA
jgi:hypothetical protein